ncbi:MAG: hypothetical protein IT303_03055 [Dehalococcoidia bacterium]|nr:hypothetical protein [Dehalococcoidia bacterium]
MTSPAKRPAPEFRPPAKRQRQERSAGPLSRIDRRARFFFAGMAVVLIGAIAAGAFLLLRDDSDSSGGSTGGTQGGADTKLAGPASRYVPEAADFSVGYEVFPPETFSLSALQFASNGLFGGTTEGEEKAELWRYESGYQASFQPTGLLAEVVQGKYYVRVESYLFEDVAGAKQAYAAYEERYSSTDGSERVDGVKGLANESSAWKFLDKTIANTELRGVYHRFVFRRGSLVSIVQTMGAEPFMTIDQARDVAVLVDEKALGTRLSPTPTPRSTATTTTP